MTDTQRAHAASHSLPISNGWSGGWGPGSAVHYSVWCGRCGDSFLPDLDWIGRYFAARRRKADQSHAKGYLSRGQHLDMIEEIAKNEQRICEWLNGRGKERGEGSPLT